MSRRVRGAGTTGRRVVGLGPPQFNANPEVTRRFRFVATGAYSGSVTDVLLLTVCGNVAHSAAATYPIAQAVKLNAIEIFTPVAAQGTSVTVSVEWPASGQNMPREVSDTSISVTQGAHIYTVPPRQSLAAFWNTGSGSNLFSAVIPSGSIIDVWLSFVLADGDAGAGGSLTLAGATAGFMYYGALDNQTSAAAVLAPVSLAYL